MLDEEEQKEYLKFLGDSKPIKSFLPPPKSTNDGEYEEADGVYWEYEEDETGKGKIIIGAGQTVEVPII